MTIIVLHGVTHIGGIPIDVEFRIDAVCIPCKVKQTISTGVYSRIEIDGLLL
jgi:hypothetical protein